MKRFLFCVFFLQILCFHRSLNGQIHGTLDPSFNPTGVGASDEIYTIAKQSDGKLIIGGNFFTYNSQNALYLARLNSDGSLDTTFNTGLGPSGPVYSLAIQPDGKILVGGGFSNYNFQNVSRALIRLHPDGSLDSLFNQGGFGFSLSNGGGRVNSIALQPDGKILVGGVFTRYNQTIERTGIIRLNPDGTADDSVSFHTNLSGSVESIAVLPDGKIMIAGGFIYNGYNNICRIHSNGQLDPIFNVSGTGTERKVLSMKIDSNGKVLACGEFISYNGVGVNNIVRIHIDGEIDTTFKTANSTFGINDIAIQNDGKVLIVGSFSRGIKRLHSNGSVDSTYSQSEGAADSNGFCNVNKVIFNDLNTLFIVGDFTKYDQQNVNHIAKLYSAVPLNTESPRFNIQQLKIYPNPVSDMLNIESDTEKWVTILDVTGKVRINAFIRDKDFIDISMLPPGAYFIRYENETQKIIITR